MDIAYIGTLVLSSRTRTSTAKNRCARAGAAHFRPVLLLLVVAVGAFVAMLVQASAGFGFGLLTAPLLIAAFGPERAVCILIVLSLPLFTLTLRDGGRSNISWPDVRVVVICAVPGLLVGYLALRSLAPHEVEALAAVLVLVAASTQLAQRLVDERLAPIAERRWFAAVIGAYVGALTTVSSLNGPTLVLWFNARKFSREATKATLGACMIALNVPALLLVFGGASTRTRLSVLELIAASLPLLFVGYLMGRKLMPLLMGDRYRKLILCISLAAGISGLIDSLL